MAINKRQEAVEQIALLGLPPKTDALPRFERNNFFGVDSAIPPNKRSTKKQPHIRKNLGERISSTTSASRIFQEVLRTVGIDPEASEPFVEIYYQHPEKLGEHKQGPAISEDLRPSSLDIYFTHLREFMFDRTDGTHDYIIVQAHNLGRFVVDQAEAEVRGLRKAG